MQVKFLFKYFLTAVSISFFYINGFGQNIILKGRLTDKTDKTPIASATVTISLAKDSTQKFLRVTDKEGNFVCGSLQMATYLVKISCTGYQKIEQKIALQASNKDAILFSLSKWTTELAGVTVISKPPPVKQLGDTTEFSASQFKVNPDATAEDLIKKLPGITVAKDGTVTTMGEQVQKVTVDGKDFFGDDATAALRNLPADVIDKIQVFDKLSDQAQLTGFDDGNSVKAINIVTKSGIRNGQFGRIYAGAGTDSRYSAGGNVSFFNGNRRISLVGNFNNINQQNFSSQDLLGATSSGGRGGNRNSGGGADNFNVGQVSGISKTNAAGINFSNIYAKKLTLTGSYFFNNSTNNNEDITNLETFLNTTNLFSNQNSATTSTNTNHRINMRIEYKLDSFNSIFIIPNFSFQNNKSLSNSSTQNYYDANDTTNTSISNGNNNKNGYNLKNNILFRHAFAKKGRTLSLGFNTNFTKNDGTVLTNANYKFFKTGLVTDSVLNRFSDNATNGNTLGGTMAYTEPIGKKGQIQMDYTLSVQKNKANQQTFEYDGQKYSLLDTTLSNKFDNTTTTHNIGLNYRLGKSKDEQLSFGLNFQHANLQSQRIFPVVSSVNQAFANLLPNFMWRKKISKFSNVRLLYRASINFPSIAQLQDVVNVSNPISVSSGNPNLKQSYTHLFTGRYSYTNSKTSKSFFANIMLQSASNYITNAVFIPQSSDSTIQHNLILKKGSQLTKPINVDGYKSLRTFYTYSMPLKFIKTTLNLNAGFSYSRLPSAINYQTTITNSFAYNTGVVLASNISEFVDFNLSYNASFNNSTTNNLYATSSKYINQVTGIQINLLNKKGWFVQNDITANVYSGLSAGLNQSYWLWNAAIGKKILKKQAGEIKLSVFDLLKQNQSITRTVTGNYIQDDRVKVLQQYFMLTFTYKLKNFGTAPAKQNNYNRGPGGMLDGGFGGGRQGGGGY